MEKQLFGTTADGKDIYLYTVENSKGMKAQVMNFGANLVNLFVPDKNGNVADVTLGYDQLEKYYTNGSNFGAVIGPNANRIAGAAFELDGVRYELTANDGENNLHSHAEKGFQKKVWAVTEGDNSVTFTVESPDGEMGFPGNKKMSVTYTVTEENELKIVYDAESDKNTIINPTHHAYFNLAGHDAGSSEDHILWMKASHYTPVVKGAIPTGEIAPVAGTVMDFTTPKRMGDDINADFEQLVLTGGYDHNWVVDDWNGEVQLIATAEDPVSGRKMSVYTDMPGVQLYAGNFIGEETGKGGAQYRDRSGLCLETQYYPNTANTPSFPSAVYGPDRALHSTTIYKFE
ncbi:MAG: galactose mutarotase [Lachnospiraceae bacterium]|nr:galactose mutarotase [Lachnospiraceae bacterium]